MTEKEYLEERVDDQIAWYDRKSQRNQTWHKRLRLLEVVAAATIPLLSGYVDARPIFPVVVGLLGVVVAVVAGIISLYQFQENWIAYRATCESLKHEKFLYLTRTDPYNASEPLPLLVQRAEGLISKEHTSWTQYMKAGQKGQPVGGATTS